jgi:hypothetical protein
MPFLTDEDYDVQTRPELLAVIASSSLTRAKAELMAQATMTESLNKRFDTVAIFSAAGDNRSIIVIMYMIDLALYYLHSKTALRAMPEQRKTNFNAAKEWLRFVRLGEINPDLPELIDTNDCDDETYLGSAGSNKQRYRDW